MPRLGVLDDIVNGRLRHPVEYRRGRCRDALSIYGRDVNLDATDLADLATELLERGGEAQIVEHARMDRVREEPDLLEGGLRLLSHCIESLGQGRICTIARGGAQLKHQRSQLLRRGIVELSREARPLTIASVDHRCCQCAHARAIGNEAVEQEVE